MCRRQFKTGKDVGTKLERGFGGWLEGEGAEDVGPGGVKRIWGVRDDPEALAGVMDDGNGFSSGVTGQVRPRKSKV